MNRHDSTDPDVKVQVARMRELIERSSLGEEGPRRLRQRTTDEQVDRIHRRLERITRHAEQKNQTALPAKAARELPPAWKLFFPAAPNLFTFNRYSAPADKIATSATKFPASPLSKDHRSGRQKIELTIHSGPITLRSPERESFQFLSAYLVLMYDHAGVYVWITTPVNPECNGQYRLSTIIATETTWRPKVDIRERARSLVSEYLSRQPSSADILDVLYGRFVVSGGETPCSKMRDPFLEDSHFEIERWLGGIERESSAGEVDDVDASCLPRLPVGDKGESGYDKPIEALVIAANKRGVGLTAELREDPSSHLHNAIQKIMPGGDSISQVAPDLHKELEQAISLLEPGGKVSKSWKGALDRSRMHEIVRVFSEFLRNTDLVPSRALKPIVDAHLNELELTIDSTPVIETTWRSETFGEEVFGGDTIAGDDCSSCSAHIRQA
ncbi:hypothetical protein [Nocardia asiatica]|uniref:hypothetical protein n=1 Tax=Nocardia asiatica TaxID=209252 RepID=UPI002456931A|nr:hypothetical protein [Nocardia asiatica]